VIRKRLVKVHLWLGLCIGLLWAVQGLTGALLVFHREADRLALPAADPGPIASLDLIVGRASAAAGSRIERISIIERHGDVLSAEYHDRAGEPRSVLLDSASGRIVGRRDLEPNSPASGSFSQWLYLLHQSMLLGEDRDFPTGISGILLFAASLIGIWIAWPRRGAWHSTFAWRRWRSTDQRLYGWHRSVGLAAGLLLIVTVPCGIYLVFAGEVRPVLAKMVPHQLPYRAAPAAQPRASWIEPRSALSIAQARFPGAAFVSIAMPTPVSPVYAVRLRQARESRLWAGVTSVTVNGANGAIADVYDPLNAPLSNRIADLLFSIHNGEIAGLGGRLLVLLAGLSLPMLYAFGVATWWRRRSRRKRKGAAAAQPRTGESSASIREMERSSI
jgi:uncharacterized iron-regulated membrane protein